MSRIVGCFRCDGEGYWGDFMCPNCGGCGTVIQEDSEPDDNLDDYIVEEDSE